MTCSSGKYRCGRVFGCLDFGCSVSDFGARQRERIVTANAAIVYSIVHSPLRINPIFIVLFKPILDPAA
jgi:hypothetical protein